MFTYSKSKSDFVKWHFMCHHNRKWSPINIDWSRDFFFLQFSSDLRWSSVVEKFQGGFVKCSFVNVLPAVPMEGSGQQEPQIVTWLGHRECSFGYMEWGGSCVPRHAVFALMDTWVKFGNTENFQTHIYSKQHPKLDNLMLRKKSGCALNWPDYYHCFVFLP